MRIMKSLKMTAEKQAGLFLHTPPRLEIKWDMDANTTTDQIYARMDEMFDELDAIHIEALDDPAHAAVARSTLMSVLEDYRSGILLLHARGILPEKEGQRLFAGVIAALGTERERSNP